MCRKVDAETVARNHGISKATLYNWKSKYSGMEVSQVRRLKELEEENRKLKQMHYEKRSRLKKRLPTRVKSPLVMPAERVIKLLEKVFQEWCKGNNINIIQSCRHYWRPI